MTFKTLLHLLFLWLIYLLPQTGFSQVRDSLLERLVRENNIQTRECYHNTIVDGKLSPISVLSSKMSFDSLGRPTNYTVYQDSLEISSFLVYFYDSRGNLIKSETRYKDEVGNHTVIYDFDEQDLMQRERNIYKDKMNAEVHISYNKNNQIEKRKIEFFGKTKPKRQSITYGYNDKNKWVKTTFDLHFRGVRDLEYDSLGRFIREYYTPRKKKKVLYAKLTYDDHNQVIFRESYEYRNYWKSDGHRSFLIKKGDTITLATEYFENGLVANETERQNGVLVSFREYEYLGQSSKE